MKELLLIGGGGHCKSIIDVIEEEGNFSIAGIIDKSDLLEKTVLGYPIIGNDLDFAPGFCGKGGQSISNEAGQPTILVSRLTVGGTKI